VVEDAGCRDEATTTVPLDDRRERVLPDSTDCVGRDLHLYLVVLLNEKAALYARERILTARATRG
jgi:hypothetical protein